MLHRDDRPVVLMAPDFGFGERGRIDITIKDTAIWQRHNDDHEVQYDSFGMFLAPVLQQGVETVLPGAVVEGQESQGPACALNNREAQVFTFAQPQLLKVIQGKAGNATFHVDVDDGGWYYLYFANCDGAAVTFSATVAMYNLRPDGRRDYLAVGEAELQTVYWVMFALFLFLSAAWAVVLVLRRAAVHRIHALMGMLVAVKSLTLLTQALMTRHVGLTGLADGWSYVYYATTAARGLLFFSVVVLIGAGWSYMKPFMDDNTRTVLMVVVPMQVFANIALITMDEESPAMRDWLAWRDIFHIIDLACCIAIIFPIVLQIRHLRMAATVDGKAARSLAKLQLFRSFYITVIAYVYLTRVVVYLLANFTDYRYTWTSEAVSEACALAFYTWVGASFRPETENRYLHLSDEDIELATAY